MQAKPLVLKDFPPGPLEAYRKQASFDWKALKIYIEEEEIIKFKVLQTIRIYFTEENLYKTKFI